MYSITNHAHQRELIVAEFLNSFEKWMNKIEDEPAKIVETWNVHCMHKNKSISFIDKGKKNEGTFIGLNDKGFAKIDINGKIETFNSINIT
jgi:biotin-(acetyl-CoA carboxylase) ligase